MSNSSRSLPIDRSIPFDPTLFLEGAFSIAVQDEASLALTEINPWQIKLVSMLKDGETLISREENLKRLKNAGHIRLDAKVLQTLYENQDRTPPAFKQLVGESLACISFDGTEFLEPDEIHRGVLFLRWQDGECFVGYEWLDDDVNAHNLSAVLVKK